MLRTCAVLVGILLFTSSFTSFSNNAYSEESSLPEWVKNIFVWFGEGVVSESELLSAIEWLVENNIVKIKQISEDSNWKEQAGKLYIEKQNLEGDIAVLEKDVAYWKKKYETYHANLIKLDARFTEYINEQKATIKTQQETADRNEIELLARTNPLVQGLISGKLKFYIAPVPSYASSQVPDVVDAITKTLEESPFYGMKFQRVYSSADANLHISWIKEYGSHVLGEAIFKSVVKIGLGELNCHGFWQAFDSTTVFKILWHELGHSLGFGHSTDPNNVMYGATMATFETDYKNIITLDEGVYTSIKFCNSGSMGYEVSSDSQSNGFYLYVITPETNAGNFINDGQGQYYSECSAGDTLLASYSDTCGVPNGAKLLIWNKDELLQFDAIRVDVKIINLNERHIPDMTWDIKAFQYDQTWLNDVWNMHH